MGWGGRTSAAGKPFFHRGKNLVGKEFPSDQVKHTGAVCLE